MTLLPPNATFAEKALASIDIDAGDTVAALEGLLSLKENPPEALLDALIWELGLEGLRPFFDDKRELIRVGLPWSRYRGTPGAIVEAFGWVTDGAATVENEDADSDAHWHEFQVDPGHVPNGQWSFEQLKALASIAKSQGTRLSRLYHGYDVRRLVFGKNGFGALLSNDSGITDADGVRLSFGRVTVSHVVAPTPTIQRARHSRRFARRRYLGVPLFGRDIIFGETAIRNHAWLRRPMVRRFYRSIYSQEHFASGMVHSRDYRVWNFGGRYRSPDWPGLRRWSSATWTQTTFIQTAHSREIED